MKKEIITINREYASGGHYIGGQVAKALGIPLYDTEIIKEAAKLTGLPNELVEESEQRVTNSFLFNLVMNANTTQNYFEKIYLAEKEIILEKASQGPCVIIGRCANFILGKSYSPLRVFVYSNKQHRINYAVKNYNITESEAASLIKKSDHERSLYSQNMLDMVWGKPANYDMMLNSGELGISECSTIITTFYNSQNNKDGLY